MRRTDLSIIPAARVVEFRNGERRDQIPIAHAIVAPDNIYEPSAPSYIYDSSSSMQESMEVYRYAAEANPPHFQSCLKSAEHYANPNNLEFSVDRATYYYDRATLSPNHDRQLIHRGLFNLGAVLDNTNKCYKGKHEKESIKQKNSK